MACTCGVYIISKRPLATIPFVYRRGVDGREELCGAITIAAYIVLARGGARNFLRLCHQLVSIGELSTDWLATPDRHKPLVPCLDIKI